MPGGPPSLWALTDTRSAPSSSRSSFSVAEGRRGVDVHEDAVAAADRNDLLDRLEGSDLVVCGLAVHESERASPDLSASADALLRPLREVSGRDRQQVA